MGKIGGFRQGLISWDYLLKVDFKDISNFCFISKDLFEGSNSVGDSFHSVA